MGMTAERALDQMKAIIITNSRKWTVWCKKVN
jgi:hypothetical protein